MNVTLPSNLLYFSLLEIFFGLCVIVFASLQMKYKFQLALETRYQKKMGLVACLLIFFIVLGVQLHLGLPRYQMYVNYIYGAIIFVVLLELLQFFMNNRKMDKTKTTLRNVGLIVMGLVFVYIGIKTWV